MKLSRYIEVITNETLVQEKESIKIQIEQLEAHIEHLVNECVEFDKWHTNLMMENEKLKQDNKKIIELIKIIRSSNDSQLKFQFGWIRHLQAMQKDIEKTLQEISEDR